MRYQFLKENQKKYNIKKACKILKISRSGFYDCLHRRKSRGTIENEALTEIITDMFKENEGRYGSRRIQKVLLQRNIKINEKRVSRIMSKQGLIAKDAKKPYRYYPNKTQYEERENILNRYRYTAWLPLSCGFHRYLFPQGNRLVNGIPESRIA